MSSASADEWKAKGNAAFTTQKFEEAVSCFTEAIKLSPDNEVLYSNRSGAYASLQKYHEALQDAEKCVQLKPNWAKGYSRKGLAECHLKKYADCLATYKKGLEIDPTNASLREGIAKAEALIAADPVKMRVKLLIQTVLNTPKFKKHAEENKDFESQLIGVVQEVLKDPKNLQLAMGLHPDPVLRDALRVVFQLPSKEDEETSKPRPAPEQTKKAQEPGVAKCEEENLADEAKDRGNKLYSAKKFEEALKAYDEAIALYPSNLTYMTNKAAVYLEMQEYDKCIALCQEALDKRYEVRADFNKVAKILNRMAACYSRMKNYGKAIEMLEKSLMEDNNRHTRAALSEAKGLKEKKDREDYINPEVAEKHREAGNEHFKKNAYPEAKKEYDEAIKRSPTDAKLYANRSAALMKLLELPLALADADKSLDLCPTVAKVWARKGNIHSMMKEYNKAMTAYNKGLEVDSESVECRRGLEDVVMKIQETTTSDKVDEEQIKHSMADPEIQAILSDTQFRLLLGQISENPSKLMEAMNDKQVAAKIQKLMAAGILKMT